MWCDGNVFGGGVIFIWGISIRGGTHIVFGEVEVLPREYSTVRRVDRSMPATPLRAHNISYTYYIRRSKVT